MNSHINKQIGQKIRNFRRKKGLTIVELSHLLYKSKATVSKYERGEISLDIPTLYEIASILDVHINQLLEFNKVQQIGKSTITPTFFKGVTRLYSYLYDGRADSLMRNVFDIIPQNEDKPNKVYMYMNITSYEEYQNCENTYSGEIIHFDATTSFSLKNQNTPMGNAYINILASFVDTKTKWGLFTGLSVRPLMPISTKMLFSKKKIMDEEELIEVLKISDADIQKLKLFNMFSVT